MPDLIHHSVLLQEAVDALLIENERAGGVFVDGTFGRGGHSQLILERLGEKGRLIAFDKDPKAVEVAKRICDSRFEIIHGSFASIDKVLAERNIQKIDGIVLDLGISSPQIEDASRGFSFKLDGPLDMRMDPTKGISAREWLATESEKNIAEVIRTYGEERFAVQIAKAIVNGRAQNPIIGTKQLADLVAKVVKTREKGKDPATRTFQAIRIYVNEELRDLEVGLQKTWEHLALCGRVAVISFHSLEDRLVKRFFTDKATIKQPDRRLPIRAEDLPPVELRIIDKKRPSPSEIGVNPRARSALLRVAERASFFEG